jgi:hypothetical protein
MDIDDARLLAFGLTPEHITIVRALRDDKTRWSRQAE